MSTRVRAWNDRIVIGVFAAIAAVAGFGAYRLGDAHSASLQRAARREAAAMARGAAGVVEHWREERLADAEAALAHSRRYGSVWRSVATRGPTPKIRPWLQALEKQGYRAVIFADVDASRARDTTGRVGPVSHTVRAATRSAFLLGRPVLTDVHTGRIDVGHLDLVLPLYDNRNLAAAVVVLPIDPATTVVPLLRAPKRPGAPVALMRREGSAFVPLVPSELMVGAPSAAVYEPVAGTDWYIGAAVPPVHDAGSMGLPAHLMGALTALAIAAAIVAGRIVRRSRIRGALLTSNDGVLLFRIDESLFDANTAAAALFLQTRTSLLRRSVRELIPAADAAYPTFWAPDGAVVETRIARPDGSALDVEAQGRPAILEGARVLRIVVRDITARKRLDQEFKAVLDTTADAFCFVDRFGAVACANDAYCALAGGPREALEGKPAAGPLASEIDRVRAVRDRGTDRWESVYRPPSGSAVELEITGLYLPGPDQVIVHFRDVTARNAAARNLEESKQLVARIFETAPDPIYIYDFERRAIVFSNRRYQEVLGLSGKQLSRPGFDVVAAIVHPDDAAALRAASRQLLALPDGQAQQVDIRVRDAAGEWRWMHCHEVVFARGPGGRVRQILGTAQDITERIRAAEALHESSEFLNAAIDSSPLSLVVMDPGGRVRRWNKQSEAMFGWTAEEALGRFAPFVAPERRGEARALLDCVKNGAGLRGHELIHKRKDGSDIDARVWTAPVRDRNGRAVAVFAMYEDIAEEKRRRIEIENSRASLLRAHRMAQVASWEADLVANKGQWSNEAYAILGLPRDVAPTRETYMSLVHPEDRPAVEQSLQSALDTGHVFRSEHRIIRPDGAVRTIQQWVEIACDSAGIAVRASGTLQDVTEQRALRQQVDRIQKLETMGRVAGGIAHDFNNLLTIVNGYAELLVGRVADPFVAHGLREIVAAGKQASELTAKLLAFSRKQVLQPEPVDLSAVVRSMTGLLAGIVGDGVRLEIDAPEAAASVMADRVQMEQVVMNLALNARDAMPQGGTLRIRVRDDGGNVCLEVSDTGVGMTEEIRARLFEPFFTTKEPGKGTGLGLPTVYGIVTQTGGAITVQSAPNEGATFHVRLPAVAAQAASAATPIAQ